MEEEIEMRNADNASDNIPAPQPQNQRNADAEYGQPFQVPAVAPRPRKRSRQFRGRQIQMMAISLVIGSGLLFDTGGYLYLDGPVSLVLGYLIVGTIMYSVMISLGEMISLLPVPGGFFTLANRCLSPSLGFACGWAYWFAQSMSVAAQLVAASNTINLWLPNVPKQVWICVIFVIIFVFNNFNVRRYGEIEYWFTVVKVITVMGIIVAGVILPMNASPNQRLLGTDIQGQPVLCSQTSSNYTCVGVPGFDYWRENSFKAYLLNGKAGQFVGLWNSCCQAIFSYIGVELIGIAADECERQRTVLPKAVRRVSYRVIFFYVGAVTVLGLNLSAGDPILRLNLESGTQYSPFALMFTRAGIPVLPNIVNAVTLISSASCANTALYLGSRTLYALAWEEQAPKIFLTKHKWDVPVVALILTALPSVLAYAAVRVGSTSWFEFLKLLTVTGSVVTWSLICATYLRFRLAARKHPGVEGAIPPAAKSPLQPFLAIYGFIFSALLLLFQGFQIFDRYSVLWTWDDVYWGYYIAPWIALALILILIFGYLGQEYYRNRNRWSWMIPSLRKANLHDGVAPEDAEEEPSLINRILDAI